MATDFQTRSQEIQDRLRDMLKQGVKEDEIDPRLVQMVRLLDDAVTIPGTSLKFGLDGILGLIPGLGDTVSMLFTVWLDQEAKRLGVGRLGRMRMWFNSVVDFAIGVVPLVGDLFDFAWKANRKNLTIIEKHLEKRKRIQLRSDEVVVR